LHTIDVPQPKGKTATSPKEALENAREIGYPVVSNVVPNILTPCLASLSAKLIAV
jgi:hypothetical protein